MLARILMAGLMLAAACSCVPTRDAGYRVSVAVPDPDRSLLAKLALGDPLDTVPLGKPLASPLAAAPAFFASPLTDDGQRAQDCLTAAVYYEARSEPLDGQRAVAQVVLNRVRDRAFPASVCGVVYQRTARVCQFTFACDGSTAHPIQPRAWAIARAVAVAALTGSVYEPVGSATHYHANYVSPWWAPSLSRVAAIGSHIFYRWRSGLADALSYRQAYAGHEVVGGGWGVANAVHVAVGDAQNGVTVHRGGSGDPDAAPAAEQGTHIAVASSTGSFGVRIHRNGGGAEALTDAESPPGDE